MVLHELFEDEQHPAYRALASTKLEKQYDFLGEGVHESVDAAVEHRVQREESRC